MPSKRTIITLSDVEKRWLMDYTKTYKVSMAEAIRRGIACLKASHGPASYLKTVNGTKGIWQKGDGLRFQEQLRSEWES